MFTDRETLIRTISDLNKTIRKRDEQIQALRVECRDLARDYARAHLALTEHRPLAVGDRVRVVTPRRADGVRATSLSEGDIGTVVTEANEDGDILFRRDGTEGGRYIAAANVERIEDES